MDCYIKSDLDFPVNSYMYDDVGNLYKSAYRLFTRTVSGIAVIKIHHTDGKEYTFSSLQELDNKMKVWLTFS